MGLTAAGESPRPAKSASVNSDVSDDAPLAAVHAPRRRPVSGPTLKSDAAVNSSSSQLSKQQQQQQASSATNGTAFAAIDNAAAVLAVQKQQQQQRRRRRSSDASSSSASNAAAGASAALRRVTLSAGATTSSTAAAATAAAVAVHTVREEDAALFRCIALKGSLKEKLSAYDQGRALQSGALADSSSSAAAAAERDLATDSFVQLLTQSNPAHKRPRAGTRWVT
jgi:hypothetical protein